MANPRTKLITALIAVICCLVIPMAFASSGEAAPLSGASLAIAESSPSAFTTTTQTFSDGTTATSSAALESSTLITGADGYPCGDVAYNGIVKRSNVFGWVVWTYKSHFGVHVCHNKVQRLNSLYDEPVDTAVGWSWCGNIVRDWGPHNLPYSSAHSYTKGCFYVVDKLVDGMYPWVKQTIGGNGGLWARTWGVG